MMKRILSLILSLILCFGFIVSCGKEEEQSSVPTSVPTSEAPSSSKPTQETPSSSAPPVSEEPSSREPSITDFQEPTTETLDGITREFFDSAYTAYTGYLHKSSNSYGSVDEILTRIVTSYDEFLKYQGTENIITEEIFEDNFVILINGLSGCIRTEDIYYTDFKKADGYYTLTYNLAFSEGQMFQDMEEHYADICVIPRELCEDDLSTIDVKIISKSYEFEDKNYESSCTVTTCLPKVD